MLRGKSHYWKVDFGDFLMRSAEEGPENAFEPRISRIDTDKNESGFCPQIKRMNANTMKKIGEGKPEK